MPSRSNPGSSSVKNLTEPNQKVLFDATGFAAFSLSDKSDDRF